MNTSVLIYSCDKYSDVWEPFFTLFFRYWDCPYRVYIATETLKCRISGVTTLNTTGTWTERMKAALEQIPTKYVIGMCEDMFFRKKVKDHVISNCIESMEKDETIGCFNFEKEYEPGIALLGSTYDGFGLKPQGHHFQKSCQPTLWRREYLISLMDGQMDAWNWEWAEREYPLEHYIWTGRLEETVFDYGLHDRQGFGIVQGKWYRDDVVPLFEREKIEVDFSKRGFA